MRSPVSPGPPRCSCRARQRSGRRLSVAVRGARGGKPEGGARPMAVLRSAAGRRDGHEPDRRSRVVQWCTPKRGVEGPLGHLIPRAPWARGLVVAIVAVVLVATAGNVLSPRRKWHPVRRPSTVRRPSRPWQWTRTVSGAWILVLGWASPMSPCGPNRIRSTRPSNAGGMDRADSQRWPGCLVARRATPGPRQYRRSGHPRR
jgi:hypothetical protein